jgi:AraC-like DNA-binding protein
MNHKKPPSILKSSFRVLLSNKKLFYNFLLNYFLLLLVPVLAIIILYFIISQRFFVNAKTQMMETANLAVSQLKYRSDNIISRSQSVAYGIWQADEINYYLQLERELDVTDTFMMYKIGRHLVSSIMNIYDFADDILIRLNTLEICIGQDGYLDDKSAYEYFVRDWDEPLSYEEWKDLMTGFTVGKLYLSPDGNNLYFMQSMPISIRENESRGMLSVKINSKTRRSFLFAENTPPQTSLYLVNEFDGSIITATAMSRPDPDFRFSPGGRFLAEDGNLLAWESSEYASIAYLCTIPASVLNRELEKIRLSCIIITFICLGGSASLMFVLLCYRYNPLNQLSKAIRGESYSSASWLDPHGEIQAILLDAVDEGLALTDRNKQAKGQSIGHHLYMALREVPFNDSHIRDFLRHNGPDPAKLRFLWIKSAYLDGGSYFEKNNEGEGLLKQPRVICQNVFHQILGERNTVFSFYDNNIIYFVLFMNLQDNTDSINIEATIVQVQRYLRENHNLEVFAAVSSVYTQVADLPQALREADNAFDAMMLVGQKTLVRYHGSADAVHGDSMFMPLPEEARLMGSLRSGDFMQAKEIFNAIIVIFLKSYDSIPQILRLKIYKLIGTMLEIINSLDMVNARALIEKISLGSDVLNLSNITEFQNQMNYLFDELDHYYQETMDLEKNQFVAKIKDFVTENYGNPNLNVSMISYMLNRNLDYVSRTFKKLTGIGLLDYIHKVRIDIAKSALTDNQNLPVQQISSMVGYQSCESFIRLFKRSEGITPGRYRNLH